MVKDDHLWGRCYSVPHKDQFEVQDHMERQEMTYSHTTDPTKNGYEVVKEDSNVMGFHKITGTTDFKANTSRYEQQKAKLSGAWRDSLGKVNADSQPTTQAPSLDGLSAYEKLKQQRSNAWRK